MGKGRRRWNYFEKCNRKVCCQTFFTFVAVLNACASMVAIKEGRSDGIHMSKLGIAWLTCMQNVEVWRRLGNCQQDGIT